MASGSHGPSEIMILKNDGTPIPVELRGRAIHYRGTGAWASVWRNLAEWR